MNLPIKKKAKIQTERLCLKPYSSEDAGRLAEFFKNDEISKTFQRYSIGFCICLTLRTSFLARFQSRQVFSQHRLPCCAYPIMRLGMLPMTLYLLFYGHWHLWKTTHTYRWWLISQFSFLMICMAF